MQFVIALILSFAPDAQPVFTCPTVENARAANQCRAQCRETNDAKNASCNDAYKQCAFSCKGDDVRDCRQRCRDSYDACRTPLVPEYKQCLDGCVTSNGCSLD